MRGNWDLGCGFVFWIDFGVVVGCLLGAFWELFGHLGGTLGRLGQPWGTLGVTWEPFGCIFWKNFASLDALGLKIVPGLLKVTLLGVFCSLLEDLGCF